MKYKILITSTSFKDTPGDHHKLLEKQNWSVDYLRGPLLQEVLLPIIGKYDGVICGDDQYSEEVLSIAKKGKLKGISKYGVGLDKIDLVHAKSLNIPVTNCPGVNKRSVAEHVFALLLSFKKNIHKEYISTSKGAWPRLVGSQISKAKLGIVGLGNIGKEVAKIAKAFDCRISFFDEFEDKVFTKQHRLKRVKSLEELFEKMDIISIHMNLNNDNYNIISKNLIKNHTRKGLVLINTARGELVDEDSILYGLKKGILSGYLCDVLSKEPQEPENRLHKHKNVIITSHISSKTIENVAKQGNMAINNLIDIFNSK